MRPTKNLPKTPKPTKIPQIHQPKNLKSTYQNPKNPNRKTHKLSKLKFIKYLDIKLKGLRWVRREGNPSPTFLVQTTLGRNPKTLPMRRTSPPSRLPSLYRSERRRNRVVGSVSCWRIKRRRRRSLSRRLLCGGRSWAVRKGVPSKGSGRRGEGYTPSLSRLYSHLDPGSVEEAKEQSSGCGNEPSDGLSGELSGERQCWGSSVFRPEYYTKN
ncbi:hypothetical protein LXL04_008051 [Taraxacum kok-saghyz]